MKLALETWDQPRGVEQLRKFSSAVVFGASPAAAEVTRFLAGQGVDVAAYADNSPAKQAAGFEGKAVFSAAAAADFANEGGAVVIASAYQTEIALQLIHELGAPSDAIFPYVSGMFAHHFGMSAIEPHRARIEALLDVLADEDSRAYVRALTKFRWTMSPLDLPRNARVTGFYGYRAEGMGPFKGGHIVDCGAYTGDTAEAYLDRLGGDASITAIEPMPENFRRLVETIRAKNWAGRVMPVNAAVGARSGVVTMAALDGGPDPRASIKNEAAAASTQVQVASLDAMFEGRFDKVDLIKIDIEGFELDALEGAQSLIRAAKPDLAVAGYHKNSHMWEVPEAIRTLAPGYEIHAGHHPSAAYEIEFYCTHPERRAKAA